MYSIEEQEKIDAFKGWWKAYGVYVWVAALVVAVGGAGGTFLHQYQASNALDSAQKFLDMQVTIDSRNLADSQIALKDISKGFSPNIYSDFAGLKVARLAYEEGKVDLAVENFRRIFSEGLSDDTKAMAGLRLAAILIEQNKIEEALEVLSSVEGGAYSMLVSDLKADALFKRGELKEAILSLDSALDQTDNTSAWRSIIEMKKDSIESKQ